MRDKRDGLGDGGAFFVFSAIVALGTIFIAFMVPETKGKTLEEIQAELAGVKAYPLAGDGIPTVIDEEDEEDTVRRVFAL